MSNNALRNGSDNLKADTDVGLGHGGGNQCINGADVRSRPRVPDTPAIRAQARAFINTLHGRMPWEDDDEQG